jgi:hypothetical protein
MLNDEKPLVMLKPTADRFFAQLCFSVGIVAIALWSVIKFTDRTTQCINFIWGLRNFDEDDLTSDFARLWKVLNFSQGNSTLVRSNMIGEESFGTFFAERQFRRHALSYKVEVVLAMEGPSCTGTQTKVSRAR